MKILNKEFIIYFIITIISSNKGTLKFRIIRQKTLLMSEQNVSQDKLPTLQHYPSIAFTRNDFLIYVDTRKHTMYL